jgi:hypothetical protein
METFDERVTFYRAAGISQGTGVLTIALIRGGITNRERCAIRAARLYVSRKSGRDRRERIEEQRAEFEGVR